MGLSSENVVSTLTPCLDRVKGPGDLKAMSRADLNAVASELRNEIIGIVSETGGHLGSSLGVVELTVALHAVFDTPTDKLIWDVSHQCYPHKVLTGRRDRMRTLRKRNGLSGFTRRSESPYDPFGAAHSSTSISAGLGFAMARELGAEEGDVVCVIGDGAMSAGMAYEAMNNAGALGKRLFVILNDNTMSISPSTGAFSSYLSTLVSAGHANDAQEEASSRCLFEHLGFEYHGPIDGHDLNSLLDKLTTLRRDATGPILLHCVTRKGAGYAYAEASDDKYHGVANFDVSSGQQVKTASKAPSYTKVFARALIAEAERDPKIVAITAAMATGTGIDLFQKAFPERSFDVGIAEQQDRKSVV